MIKFASLKNKSMTLAAQVNVCGYTFNISNKRMQTVKSAALFMFTLFAPVAALAVERLA